MAVNVKITDVAKAAGISQSTASFVLSGRGDEMHISKETQELVWAKAKELGYRPSNLSRRMRKSRTSGIPTVTIFWSVDQNYVNLGRAFNIMQNVILQKKLNIQTVLKPFLVGHLSDILQKNNANYFNGAIVGGASADDIQSITGMHLKMPIIFFERNHDNFHSVYSNYQIGPILAERMAQRGITSAAIFLSQVPGASVLNRLHSIEAAFAEHDISVQLHPMDHGLTYMQYGKEATKAVMSAGQPPQLLLYLHEELAIGGIDALRELGLKSGEDVEVAAYASGTALDYLGMPITRIRPQLEELVETTLELLIDRIDDEVQEPKNVMIDCIFDFAGKLK